MHVLSVVKRPSRLTRPTMHTLQAMTCNWLSLYGIPLIGLHGYQINTMTCIEQTGHTHTDIHTHRNTHTCYTTARTGYVAPIQGVSQQKATRLVAPLAAVSSPQLHGPLSAVRALIYGLAMPMRWEKWGMALSDGIRISVLGSWL